jgi:FkbM family methyltransferase
MLARLGYLYALLLGWPALARLHKAALYLSLRALGVHNYESPRVSGEQRVIKLALSDRSAPIVFDVGANEGHWTTRVLTHYPDATVHVFEPQKRLAEQIARQHRVAHVNNIALGNVAGTLELRDYADHPGSQHASLLPGVIDGIHHGTERRVLVEVATLDAYCRERGIDRIDLLKIDVEGFERQVLEGARRLLDAGSVHAIQFEFNEMNVVGRTFMADFMAMLEKDYEVFRLLPHGLLRLRSGSHWINEQFAFQNILALRSSYPTPR